MSPIVTPTIVPKKILIKIPSLVPTITTVQAGITDLTDGSDKFESNQLTVGIVVGTVELLVIALVVSYFCYRRWNFRKRVIEKVIQLHEVYNE